MKRIITLAALIAAHAIAAAGPALMAPELRQAPRIYTAVALTSPAPCGYSEIRAAVLLRELAPSLPALTARGCIADAAQAHLLRMEDEQHIERVAGGWRVK